MATIAERVERGVRLLNRKKGRRWYRRIDLEWLNLAEPCRCIVGQLYGDYMRGIRELGVDGLDEGFTTTKSFPALTLHWKRRIRQLLRAEKAQPR